MLQSMTGYGEATQQTTNLYIHVTIKTLNSKYLDIQFNQPKTLTSQEATWRKLLGKHLQRGNITFSVTYLSKSANPVVTLNKPLLKNYYHTLSALAKELQATTDLFQHALNAPEVIQRHPPTPLSEANLLQVKQVVQQTLAQCVASREIEGKFLRTQLTECLSILHTKLAQIVAYTPKRTAALRARLEEKLTLRKELVDANRWEQEVLYYLEKLDIKEEEVRLQSHLTYFSQVMQQTGKIGKKLSFIGQEIGRELNTIGSKVQDANLQHLVVQMKEILSQMKEQVQNIV